MKVPVPLKRVVDYNAKVRVTPDSRADGANMMAKPEAFGVDSERGLRTLKVSKSPKRGGDIPVSGVATLVDKLKHEATVI